MEFALFSASAAQKPNVVYILADDLGSGDIACYIAEGRSTPGRLQKNNGPTSFRSEFDQAKDTDSGIEF